MKKTLFITGGSRGIGRGIALVFAQNGYDVAFTYHTAEDAAVSLKKEIEQLGQKAYYRQASLEEKGTAHQAVSWAAEVLGEISCIVCNAGLTVHTDIRKMKEEDIDFVYRLDYAGYLLCASEAAKHMISGEIPGRILFVTSSRGQRVYPEDALYGGMKAGLHRACESMALELSEYGITVNCIAPGNTAIRGNFTGEELSGSKFQQKIPMGRSGTPKEVGKLAYFLAAEDAGYITGTVVRIDGGLILPVMPEDVSEGAGPGWHELPAYMQEK